MDLSNFEKLLLTIEIIILIQLKILLFLLINLENPLQQVYFKTGLLPLLQVIIVA